MIIISSLKLFRNIINKNKPITLYNLVKPGHINKVNTRIVNKFYPIIKPKLSDTKSFFINKICEIWNSLSIGLHNLSDKNFDTKIKKFAKTNFSNSKLHREGGYIII